MRVAELGIDRKRRRRRLGWKQVILVEDSQFIADEVEICLCTLDTEKLDWKDRDIHEWKDRSR